jgi:hypothetical protein
LVVAFPGLAIYSVAVRPAKPQATKETAAKSRRATKARQSKTLAVSPRTVTFHYIKAADFRTVHMDGAIGGITTRGFMHFSVYSERPPVPQETTHAVLPEGALGEEIVDKRKSRKGIVRTLEVDVIVNETTARELRAWLDK